PDKNEAMTTSSRDKVNASSHAASNAGKIKGKVTTKKTFIGVAPRSSAASSSERSRSRMRDWMMTATYAMHKVTWPTQMVNTPLPDGQPKSPPISTNISNKEMPKTTSGMT